MRVLIIGSGTAGQNLAEKLCAEKHDVVLIDRQEEALAEAQASTDADKNEADAPVEDKSNES